MPWWRPDWRVADSSLPQLLPEGYSPGVPSGGGCCTGRPIPGWPARRMPWSSTVHGDESGEFVGLPVAQIYARSAPFTGATSGLNRRFLRSQWRPKARLADSRRPISTIDADSWIDQRLLKDGVQNRLNAAATERCRPRDDSRHRLRAICALRYARRWSFRPRRRPFSRAADALIPAPPSVVGAPSRDWTARTAYAAARCSSPTRGTAPSHGRTGA